MLSQAVYKQNKTGLLLAAGVSVLVGLSSIMLGSMISGEITEQAVVILLINLFNLLITFYYLRSRLKNSRDYMDFGFVFGLFFGGYNAVLLISVGLNYILMGYNPDSYPVNIDGLLYIKASIASLLAAAGLLAGEKLSLIKTGSKTGLLYDESQDGNRDAYFLLGLILFLFGIALLFMDFRRIGGFFHALTLDRGIRLNLLSNLRGNLPYTPFVYAGLALLTYSQRTLRLISVQSGLLLVCLTTWVVLMLAQGDRRLLFYSILVFLTVYLNNKTINSRRMLKYLVPLYILSALFQQTRFLIPLILNLKFSLSDAVNLVTGKFSAEWLLPGSTEFGGPYFSLLWYLQNDFEYLYGYTYLMSVPNILPRSLYPGEKPLTTSQAFANHIHDLYDPHRQSVMGWGFSPVAESYINFGFIGIFFVFITFALLFKVIAKFKSNNRYGILIVAILVPQAFNLNRINFSSVIQECSLNLVVIVFAIIIVRIMASGVLEIYKPSYREMVIKDAQNTFSHHRT